MSFSTPPPSPPSPLHGVLVLSNGYPLLFNLSVAIGMPGLREVLQAKWPRPGLEPETLDPGAPIFVFNVNHDTGEVEVEECVYFLHFYGDETDGKFRGKAVSFSTIIRNLQLQATHSELAAALAEVGNPDENAEH